KVSKICQEKTNHLSESYGCQRKVNAPNSQTRISKGSANQKPHQQRYKKAQPRRQSRICNEKCGTVRSKSINTCCSQIHLSCQTCDKIQSQNYDCINQDTINYHHIVIIIQYM